MNNGDLISREALMKKYCKEPAHGDCKNCDWFGDSWCRCEIFGVQIAEATAVDAVEVVHGRWIPMIDEPTPLKKFAIITGYKCSVCGRCENEEEPYCNFGARMDGE